MLRSLWGKGLDISVIASAAVVGLFGLAGPAVATPEATVAVVVVGSGSVVSQPPGSPVPEGASRLFLRGRA